MVDVSSEKLLFNTNWFLLTPKATLVFAKLHLALSSSLETTTKSVICGSSPSMSFNSDKSTVILGVVVEFWISKPVPTLTLVTVPVLALDEIPSNLLPSVAMSLPSTVLLTTILPVTVIPALVVSNFLELS